MHGNERQQEEKGRWRMQVVYPRRQEEMYRQWIRVRADRRPRHQASRSDHRDLRQQMEAVLAARARRDKAGTRSTSALECVAERQSRAPFPGLSALSIGHVGVEGRAPAAGRVETIRQALHAHRHASKRRATTSLNTPMGMWAFASWSARRRGGRCIRSRRGRRSHNGITGSWRRTVQDSQTGGFGEDPAHIQTACMAIVKYPGTPRAPCREVGIETGRPSDEDPTCAARRRRGQHRDENATVLATVLRLERNKADALMHDHVMAATTRRRGGWGDHPAHAITAAGYRVPGRALRASRAAVGNSAALQGRLEYGAWTSVLKGASRRDCSAREASTRHCFLNQRDGYLEHVSTGDRAIPPKDQLRSNRYAWAASSETGIWCAGRGDFEGGDDAASAKGCVTLSRAAGVESVIWGAKEDRTNSVGASEAMGRRMEGALPRGIELEGGDAVAWVRVGAVAILMERCHTGGVPFESLREGEICPTQIQSLPSDPDLGLLYQNEHENERITITHRAGVFEEERTSRTLAISISLGSVPNLRKKYVSVIFSGMKQKCTTYYSTFSTIPLMFWRNPECRMKLLRFVV
ncbi:hypothetical protein FB451DRAFT_1369240 [Mycena latifolia]|nr:hypothetical protein FB451DRAFT_1369240 [Mycena latifolia]